MANSFHLNIALLFVEIFAFLVTRHFCIILLISFSETKQLPRSESIIEEKSYNDINGNKYEIATSIINAHKMQKLKESHATRFLQILLGYKSCYGYISMTEKYGCHCGLQKPGCSTSKDCLDDCCR